MKAKRVERIWRREGLRAPRQGGTRNTAWMLTPSPLAPGYDLRSVVRPNAIEACAWWRVLLGRGDPRMDTTDTSNHNRACGGLTDEQMRQVQQMVERIRAQGG